MNNKVSNNKPVADQSSGRAHLITAFQAAGSSLDELSKEGLQGLTAHLQECAGLLSEDNPASALLEETISVVNGIAAGNAIASTDLLQRALDACTEILKAQSALNDYFWLINDLRCEQQKIPLSELIFAIPADHSAAVNDGLVSVIPVQNNAAAEHFEKSFEIKLQAVMAAGSDNTALQELAAFCRLSIEGATHEYAALFWLTSACYINNITQTQLNASAAHRYVFRQIELVVQQHVRDADSVILDSDGIALVEKTLCNMLSYIACIEPVDPVFDRLEVLFQMHRSVQAIGDNSVAENNGLLDAGVSAFLRKIARLKLDIDAAPDTAQSDMDSLIADLRDIRDSSTVLLGCKQSRELSRAADGLRNYQSGSGALSDLEQSVTALIRIETLTTEKYRPAGAGESGVMPESDERELDAHIVAEMLSMLEPLNDAAVDSVNREWLTVALADIASLSTFQGDGFLAQQFSRVKTRIADSQTPSRSLQSFAQAVYRYLSLEHTNQPADEARNEIHEAVKHLNHSSARVESPVDFAELANENRALLVGNDEADKASGRTESSFGEVNSIVQSADGGLSNLEFGDKCNRFIDTIQLALDTALGSSGNLAPDKTVTDALENLHQVVSTEHTALLKLIEPLSQVLNNAEQANSLLSQSDTLLIQEAIVAITIGVDAVANDQSMPELVADVAQRITELAVDETHNARGGFEASGLMDVFVEEGEDLAQRLFELFQRWRSAPQGGSRIQGDIKRLLHTLKGSADTVGLSQVAQVAHGLESHIAVNEARPAVAADFFTLATDAVEVILEDIDFVRNGEVLPDRSEFTSQLSGTLSLDRETVKASHKPLELIAEPVARDDANSAAVKDPVDKTPAFGSAKYFDRLENTQRRLSGQFWKSRELQSSLRVQLSDMQSTLQSTTYLLDKSRSSENNKYLDLNVGESLQDLKQLQSQFQNTLEQFEVLQEQQLVEVKELQSMVATTDLVSVEHLELRAAALIQHLSESRNKPLQLDFKGSTLELDRKQFNDLYKPLEQLIINAVVHGIEDTGDRQSAGKEQTATISVTFAVNDKHLQVVVEDNGAGIDFERLRTYAKQRAKYNDQSSDEELLRSIVEQGVSTSASIDRSAGRGVGLDIVKEWVLQQHGELSVATQFGVGTVFTLSIPLVYDTASVMVVRQGESLFAVDVEKIVEVKEREETGLSLGALTGVGNDDSRATLSCRADTGVFDLNVDEVIGRKTIKFTNEDRFLSAGGHFLGCGVVDHNQVVFRLDLNRLIDSQDKKPLVQTRSHSEPASVLIVDDSVTIRAAFGRAMQSAGYQIVLARNGLEAMEYLETHQPEVIILDLEMPLMDGYELGSYIRKDPRLKRSALVIVSSKPRAVVGDWLTAVNADAYYEKPCSETAIAGLVAELV